MAGVQERVLEGATDILGTLAGHVVNDLPREEADLEGPLVLAFPVEVLRLTVDHDDGVAERHLLQRV